MIRTLPALREPSRAELIAAFVGVLSATVMLAVLAYRIVVHGVLWHWYGPSLLVMGILAADFLSGLVHWGADTWGRDDIRLIGPAILVPFRVHHVNPDDFLRRRFLDTNGYVAFATLPTLLALLAVPTETAWGGPLILLGGAMCSAGVMTNQLHQWAHMPSPPRLIRVLQDCGVLLGRAAHARHHASPYNRHYCITTGWCNELLDGIGFFPKMERIVERVTGLRPRADDECYAQRYRTR
jgi:ubiquitin-conjugating enzyme E2 variant